jgi:hypothetical protein
MRKKLILTLVVSLGVYLISLQFIKWLTQEKLKAVNNLEYTDLSINLLANFRLDQFTYTNQQFAVSSAEVNLNVNYISTLLSNQLEIDHLSLDSAVVEAALDKSNIEVTTQNPKYPALTSFIKALEFKNTRFVFKTSTAKAEVKNLNLSLSNVSGLGQLDFNSIEMLQFKELSYPITAFQTLQLNDFTYKNKDIKIKKLSFIPLLSKQEFSSQLDVEKDLLNLQLDSISAHLEDFELTGGQVQKLIVDHLLVNSARLDIARDKTLPDSKVLKPSFSKLLKQIPFAFGLGKLEVKNADLIYQEKRYPSKEYASINFNNIQLTLVGLDNYKSKQAQLNASLSLNKNSHVHLDLNYNLLSSDGDFSTSIKAKNVQAKTFSEILKQSMKTSISGQISAVNTTFKAVNQSASGNFQINAQDVKLSIYSKSGKKRRFLSLMANKMVSDTIDQSFKIQAIKRDQTKSFWNFIWSYIKSGLKKSLLIS